MSRRVLALLTVVLLLPLSAVFAGAIEIDRDVVYGHKMGMALTFDVVHPEAKNGAAVLFMVSGGWISRWIDPSDVMETGDAFGPFAQLRDEGFTVFLIRHGSSPLFKVPDAVSDVRRAVRYIRSNASEFGIDAERMGVFGGSAGGHLSLMLGNGSDEGTAGAEDPIESVSNRVAAVVAYFPPVDLRGLVGPNDRFPALDFDGEKAADVSPLLFVTEDDPPTLLVHGDEDPLVPLAQSEMIQKAFAEAGVEHKLVVIEGAKHGFRGADQEEAATELVGWFKQHLLTGDATASGGAD